MAADVLQINGQEFLAVRLAAREVSYSKDYITRLAREQKIRAVSVGRSWYVDHQSLAQYAELQVLEAAARRRQLKYQRQTELHLREQMPAVYVSPGIQFVIYPVLLVLMIVAVGFLSGAQLSQFTNLASVFVAVDSSATDVVDTTSTGPGVMQPVFTAEGVAAVDEGREVVIPDTSKDWLRIRYD